MESNYTKLIEINNPSTEVFMALTEQIQDWWSKNYEGSASKVNDQFTVRFGNTFKTMRIESIEPNKEVVWRCIDQHLEMPEGMEQLNNKREWVGNKLIWSIESRNLGTDLKLIHEGLTPEVECWGVCEQGWDQSLQSLKSLLSSGKGSPFEQLDEQHLQKAKAWKN